MGPRHVLSFCACKTAYFATELLDSMGLSHHLWCLQAKERLFDQNNKSLWVPHLTCRFVYSKQRDSTRNTSLYWSQPSSVIFTFKTSPFGPELQVSMGSRHHLSFSACKTSWLATEKLVSIGPSPHLWFLDAKQRLLDHNNKSQWHPDLTCCFVYAKQCD